MTALPCRTTSSPLPAITRTASVISSSPGPASTRCPPWTVSDPRPAWTRSSPLPSALPDLTSMSSPPPPAQIRSLPLPASMCWAPSSGDDYVPVGRSAHAMGVALDRRVLAEALRRTLGIGATRRHGSDRGDDRQHGADGLEALADRPGCHMPTDSGLRAATPSLLVIVQHSRSIAVSPVTRSASTAEVAAVVAARGVHELVPDRRGVGAAERARAHRLASSRVAGPHRPSRGGACSRRTRRRSARRWSGLAGGGAADVRRRCRSRRR